MIGFKYSIKLVLQQSNSNAKATAIRCYVRYNNTRCIFPTGLYIEPQYWNGKAQEPRQTTRLINSDMLRSDVNNVKKWVATAFEHLVEKSRTYPETEELKTLAVDTIKNKGIIPGATPAVSYQLLNYFDRFILDSTAGRRVKAKGERLGVGTIKSYRSFLALLKRFAAFQGCEDYSFDDVDLNFYNDLREYCFAYEGKTNEHDEKEGITDNYFGAIIKVIKTVMSEAADEGLHHSIKYKNKRFVRVNVEVDNIYLTTDQVQQLANLDLSKNLKLDRVRDLFLVGCWTGLRFSDFNNLNEAHFQGDTIEIKTKKTGEIVAIPIHPIVENIRIKYAGLTGNALPPAISNQKMNSYLKDLCKEAGFNEIKTLTRAKAGRTLSVSKPLYELVSTHTARRTFASNMFKMGVPPLIIAGITGHRTEHAFLKYIKATAREKAEMMREIWNRQAMKAI